MATGGSSGVVSPLDRIRRIVTVSFISIRRIIVRLALEGDANTVASTLGVTIEADIIKQKLPEKMIWPWRSAPR